MCMYTLKISFPSFLSVPSTQSSLAVTTGQKRKRASRWGVQPQTSTVPPPNNTAKDDRAISAAIASFSGASSTQSQQQDLNEAQKQQLREQIEVCLCVCVCVGVHACVWCDGKRTRDTSVTTHDEGKLMYSYNLCM